MATFRQVLDEQLCLACGTKLSDVLAFCRSPLCLDCREELRYGLRSPAELYAGLGSLHEPPAPRQVPQ